MGVGVGRPATGVGVGVEVGPGEPDPVGAGVPKGVGVGVCDPDDVGGGVPSGVTVGNGVDVRLGVGPEITAVSCREQLLFRSDSGDVVEAQAVFVKAPRAP